MTSFAIPQEITFGGSVISVRFNSELDTIGKMGLWDPSKNEISINPSLAPAVQFEAFCHEVAEAINSKFVNEGQEGESAPHTIVDAYGRGIFNFLIENVERITRITEHE